MNRSFYESKSGTIIYVEDNGGERVYVTGISYNYSRSLSKRTLNVFYKELIQFTTKRDIMRRLAGRLKGERLTRALSKLERIEYD